MASKTWVVLGVHPDGTKIADEVEASTWGEAIYVARTKWKKMFGADTKRILTAGVVCGRTDEETKALSVF